MTRASLFLILLLLVACAVPAGYDAPAPPNGGSGGGTDNGDGPPERVFGTIEYYEEPISVTVPETVTVGETFSVTVMTYGGGCIEQGETDVRLEARRAEIRPYDYNVTPRLPCDTSLHTFEHTATVIFTEVGEAEVVFYGQSVSDDGATNTSATRTVTVR